MALRRLIETGRWEAAPALAEGTQLAAAFNFAYGDVLAAGQDPARLSAARARLEAAKKALEAVRAADGLEYALAPAREKVVLQQARALERIASGNVEEGVALLREAAEWEAAIPAEFGPPLVEKPTRELLGDVLLRLGRKAEAAAAYEAALIATPGRRLSVRGLEAARR
jgi:predicted negative regulator of RcsB-dependent stress response